MIFGGGGALAECTAVDTTQTPTTEDISMIH